ncbi:hypothetical protein DUT91_17670 [Phyllobacterium salinisoli]|uniref:Uncharacterized protein n=2 Tax=Phyllobacterium salinisoli TaxID=1899321 RepID=A0A368JZW8_9HYPH|nr:hypothetical protein DUT91_17670 [Phyllobacterium salinisoli]
MALSGCTTNSAITNKDLTGKSTNALCRDLATEADHNNRLKIANLLVRRGATVEKCQRLIATDNSIAAGIAVATVAGAAGAAVHNGYGGGYYPRHPNYGSYGVAWDQFYNQNYQLIWRCRDRSTGRFVYDYRCAGQPMFDGTWPGWSV